MNTNNGMPISTVTSKKDLGRRFHRKSIDTFQPCYALWTAIPFKNLSIKNFPIFSMFQGILQIPLWNVLKNSIKIPTTFFKYFDHDYDLFLGRLFNQSEKKQKIAACHFAIADVFCWKWHVFMYQSSGRACFECLL